MTRPPLALDQVAVRAAALAALPGMGPARPLALLRLWPAAEAWERVAAGTAGGAFAGPARRGLDPVLARWQAAAGEADLPGLAGRLAELGVAVYVLGTEPYPARLATDHEPPAVLFAQGAVAPAPPRTAGREAVEAGPPDPAAGRPGSPDAAAPAVPRPAAVPARAPDAGGAVLPGGPPVTPDAAAPAAAAPAPRAPAGGFPPPLDVLDRPTVGIVGTRRCTPYGREVARALGRELAEAGVVVVSGLALGVDGAAHEGALAVPGGAPPVAVVGSGLDVVYPSRHDRLWARVAAAGLVLSEAPLGARPEAWRFPARNRIIAALADLVVVVESHWRGGSRHTVDAAVERGRTVMAVPGSVRSPASAGTNALLADGAPPVRDVTDVLVALGLARAGAPRPGGPAPPSHPAEQAGAPEGRVPVPRVAVPEPPEPAAAGPTERAVLAAVGWEPATFDQLVDRTGHQPGPVATALARLEEAGWLARAGTCWARATPEPGSAP